MAPFLTGAQRRMQPKLFIQKGRRITPAEKTAPEPQPPPHRQKETCGGKGASRQPAPVNPHSASAVPDHPSYRPGGKKGMLRHSTASTAFSSHCMREILLRHSCPTIKGIAISWLNRFLPERQKCFSANEWGTTLSAVSRHCRTEGNFSTGGRYPPSIPARLPLGWPSSCRSAPCCGFHPPGANRQSRISSPAPPERNQAS